MNNPLISILIPAYNVEKYIGDAIESILKQTFTNFELVIINDGSTDNTEKVIKYFNDKRIVYRCQEHQGVAKTLNNGLKICKGKYIRRHDADDLSIPNALEKQLNFLKKNPEFPIVASRIAFMTSNGKIAKKYTNPNNHFFNNKHFIEVTKNNYWKTRPIIHATILAKKKVLDEFGGYREEFPTAEDIDLWFRILEKYKIAIQNVILYFVRLHETSNTTLHGYKNKFYRDLCYSFYLERQKTGSDPLMRGEPMSKPPKERLEKKQKQDEILRKQRKLFRVDILDYKYLIYLNAKDWKLVRKSIKIAIKDGWKLKRTWKAIIFPLLGKKIVNIGVKIKSIFK